MAHLNIQNSAVSGAEIANLATLSRLHTLFVDASIQESDIGFLRSLSGLKRLDMTGARMGDAGAGLLAQVPQLEESALSQTAVSDRGFRELSQLPSLRYLELRDNRVTPEALRSSSGFPALQVLSFSTPHKLSRDDLKGMARLPSLHSLIVNGVLIGPDHIRILREGGPPRKPLSRWLIAEAHTADTLDETLEIASLPANESRRPFGGFQGLKRIHEAESSLDDIAMAAPRNPAKETEET